MHYLMALRRLRQIIIRRLGVDPDTHRVVEQRRQGNVTETQEDEEGMTPADFEKFMKTADQFASEFPWVLYADAPRPTAEEYRRALKRGTELFGHEMREIKTPRDYEEEEDSLIRILTKSNEEFMNAHDEKTPAKVYEEYERRYPELKHKDHAALVERYREDHGGKAPWEVVEEYKSAHPEQFPDE